MSLALDANIEALLEQRTHRFASCWEIERTDGTIFRFTDHDKELTVDGDAYAPTGGFSASAIQAGANLQDQNRELLGVLDAAAITHDDLRAGLYREAKVTQMLVDWRYPWAGAITTMVYWLAEIRFSGEQWEARVEGLTRWLNPKVGDLYSRTCQHVVGDSRCGVTLSSYKESGTVAAITTQRRVFTVSGLTKADGYFTFGLLTWTSGSNDGLEHEVKLHDVGGSTAITLQLPTPYDIGVADGFDISAGCDKLQATCKDKFSNLDNFGGFPFIPGNDRMLQSPRAK